MKTLMYLFLILCGLLSLQMNPVFAKPGSPIQKIVPVYFITTYFPLDVRNGTQSKIQDSKELKSFLKNIKSGFKMKYGNYDEVLWYSAAGGEHFHGIKDNPKNKRMTYHSIKIEFSIPREKRSLKELKKLLNQHLILYHPWREPVIRIREAFETRTFK